MTPSWLPYLLIVWIVLDIVQIVLFSMRISNLKKHHREQLNVEIHKSLNDGWIEGRLSLPVVQHCNRRTDYEMIRHQWDPEKCPECKIIRDLLEE